MSDRFYLQQIRATGDCPGASLIMKRRYKVASWDEDKRTQVVKMYEDANPTPENSMEIVKDIADSLEESPNGVRMILTRAGVYIKKAVTSGAKNETTNTPRVSKQSMQDELTAAIIDAGQTADADIISKLSGKAAQYLAGIVRGAMTS